MAKRAPRKGEGRPTDYGTDILKRTEEYLALCEDEEVTRGSENRPEYRIKVKIPTIEGLARHLNCSRDTVYEWAKHHPEFSYTLEQLRLEQADKLINNGLSGDYNPTITKLILSANHGMREKSDVTTDGKALPTPILAHVPSDNSNTQSYSIDEEDQSNPGGDERE